MFLSRKEKNRENHSYTGNMPSGLRCVTCRCGASKKWSHAVCSSCELACSIFPTSSSEGSLTRVAFYGDSSCYCKYSNAQKKHVKGSYDSAVQALLPDVHTTIKYLAGKGVRDITDMILAGPRHDVLILSILGNDFVHWVRRAKKKTTGFVTPLRRIRTTLTKIFMLSSPPSQQKAHDVPSYFSARPPNGDTIIATTISPNELAVTSTMSPGIQALSFLAP